MLNKRLNVNRIVWLDLQSPRRIRGVRIGRMLPLEHDRFVTEVVHVRMHVHGQELRFLDVFGGENEGADLF